MLSVYTRHYPPCPHHGLSYRRCHCPKWLSGTLEKRGYVRFSARTRSWAKAEANAREIEKNLEGKISLSTAVAAYLGDEDARKLKPETVHQKRAFLEGELLAWCRQHALVWLEQLRLPQVRQFRQTWELARTTTTRRHERLRSFFAFCMANGWLSLNPTDMLKKPLAGRTIPTDYFNRHEFQQIVAATKRYEYRGLDCRYRGSRIRALVLLMRWSGLAISDAVGLAKDRLDEKGALFLRRAKTGVPVFVPLPPAVILLLWELPSRSAEYFFWSGHGKLSSAVKGYSRSLRKLFRITGLKNPDGTRKHCRSHMFRDTFAVELLLAGVPIDQVSVLLAHRSVKMTEKHYLPWVKARQRQLTASVRRAWFPEVRRAPAVQGREAALRQTCSRPAKSDWVQFHVNRNVPMVHPFFLYT
jgi:integrase